MNPLSYSAAGMTESFYMQCVSIQKRPSLSSGFWNSPAKAVQPKSWKVFSHRSAEGTCTYLKPRVGFATMIMKTFHQCGQLWSAYQADFLGFVIWLLGCHWCRLWNIWNCEIWNCEIWNCEIGNCEIGNCEIWNCEIGNCEIGNCEIGNCEMSASFLLALALGWLSQAQRALVVGQGLGNFFSYPQNWD